MEDKQVLFFGGIPLLRIALVRRVNVVTKKLVEKGHNIILSSVASNYYRLKEKKIIYEGGPLLFFGQAHFTEEGRKKIPVNFFKYLYESLKTVSRVKKFIKKNKIQKVAIFTGLPVSLLLLLFLNKKKIRIYHDIDDFTSEQWEADNIAKKILQSILFFLEKNIPNKAHRLSVCSHLLKSIYTRAHVIPNMVELKYFKNIHFQKKYSLLKKRKLNVLFLSEIGHYHGHDDIIESIHNYYNDCKTRFHFYFIGGGSRFTFIKNRIKELHIDNIVTMTGRLEFKDVIPYFKRSSFGIIPMKNTKVNNARNPLKLLEYLASYTVVVTNPTLEIRKILINKKDGFITGDNSADSIIIQLLRLYDKREKIKKVLQNGYITAKKYSDNEIMKRWERYFEV